MKKVSIVGMGALGIMYGAYLQDHALDTVDVEFVMDGARAEKCQSEVYSVNGKQYHFHIIKSEEATFCDLLIVAVKYNGLRDALDVMKGLIGPNTLIISVMNGISSEAIIEERYPDSHVVRCIVQGMDSVKIGSDVTYSRMGTVHIGSTGGDKKYADAVRDILESVKIPYVYEEDILYRMWCKFMLNVGINQTCMVYGIGYGKALEPGEANRMLISAFRETIAVAGAEGVSLTEKEINDYIALLKTLRPDACPSMAQDRINRKPSEVEMFAGTILELAKKHDIYVPTNAFFYERIKEIEGEYIGQ